MSEQRVAIVTGSNKGIGYSIVKRLCKEFDGIVYLTARNSENGIKAVESLKKLNLNANFHQLDIENSESITRFASYLKEKYGGIDIIFNNAGLFIHKEDGLPLEQEAKTTVSLNYTGTLNVSNALFPLLRSNGRVINVSSRLGLLDKISNKALRDRITEPNLTIDQLTAIIQDYIKSCETGNADKLGFPKASYDMTKIALNKLTQIQQKEFDSDPKRKGIVVSAVCPGYCKTDATRGGGFLTADVGTETAVWLALSKIDFDENEKGAFWAEKKKIDWTSSSFLGASTSMFWLAIKSKFSKE